MITHGSAAAALPGGVSAAAVAAATVEVSSSCVSSCEKFKASNPRPSAVTWDASPKATTGIFQTWLVCERSDRKYSVRPSCDQYGAEAFASAGVTARDAPPSMGATWIWSSTT